MSHKGRNSFVLNSVESGLGLLVRGVIREGEETGVADDDRVNPAEWGFLNIKGTAVGDGVAGEAAVSVCKAERRLNLVGEGTEET